MKFLLVLFTGLAALRLVALPAFPGAEGAGANAQGGRGGTVFHVTTTNDNGSTSLAGSLRQGVSVANRTIVFDVSGTITLASDLKITVSNLTIAGQSAPGDGIAIKGWSFMIENTHDVVVRYLRCRPGDVNCASFQGDSFDFVYATNVVADHISASWSVDECLSPTHSANVTLQWCLIGESMKKSCHVKGAHGYGSLMRYNDALFTLHHNLYADNDSRNPRPGDSTRLDFVNNVAYNWGGFCGYNGNDSPDNMANGGLYFTNTLNYVSNCFVSGPNSSATLAFDSGVTNSLQCQIWQSGNYIDNNKNATLDGANTGWSMFGSPYTQLSGPFAISPVTTDAPLTAYERVLAFVGASLSRDAVDERIVRTVRTHGGKHIDQINAVAFAGDYITNTVSGTNYIAVNPWPALNSKTPPTDTDQDGLPNFWEQNLGLNPSVANNNHTNASGYTDLEDYLNYLGAPHNFGPVNATNFTDLRALTGGDTNHVFTVANATNGVVSLAADGFTANFLPATNFIGLAYFTFSVTNATNHTAFGPVVVAAFVTNLLPVIVSQPPSTTNAAGSNAQFSVGAASAGLTYQWRRGGTSLVNGAKFSGSTNVTLIITNVSVSDVTNYTVVITNFSGVVTSAPAALVLVVSAPSAPSSLTAEPTNLLINLRWNSVAGVTNYNLKRGTANGGPYPQVFGGLTLTNYSDPAVTNAVVYYYVVSALAAGGESTNSLAVSAAALPSAQPTNLSMQVTGGQLQLSWPPSHLGWRLQMQTNAPGVGLGTNWTTVGGSSNASSASVPVATTNGSVFLRLVYP